MRIALATVGTTGDVRPFAILARRLAERGHEVLTISWPMHAGELSSPGVRFEPAGPNHDAAAMDAVAVAAAGRGPMEQVGILRDFHLADGARHHRQLSELLDGHDLVLIHAIHAVAHAVALDLGLRWASIAFDPTLLPTPSLPPPGMPNVGPLNRLLWRGLDRALDAAGAPLDPILAEAGSSRRRLPLFRARSESLHIVACSPSIARVPDRLPAGVTFSGAIADQSPPDPLPAAVDRFLARGDPPIVVSFGSMRGVSPDAIAETAGLLADAGQRVIVQDARHAAAAERAGILRIGSVDHRALLPRASLVIHHAGAGTTHAVGAAATPSVTVPQIGDQLYWADRLYRLGCAPKPLSLKHASPRRIADAALSVVRTREMHDAAVRLRDRMAGDDGLGTAIRLLEAAGRA